MTDRLFVRIMTRGLAPLPSVGEASGEGVQNVLPLDQSSPSHLSTPALSNATTPVPFPQVQWALYRHDQLISGPGECGLSEVIEQLPETIRVSAIPNPLLKVIAIVPGEDVSLTEVLLPSSQAKHIAKALPYMLEDNLAEDLELVHLVLGAKRKNKGTSVAVVNRALIRCWIDLLKGNRLQPELLVPDTLLLPTEEQVWTLLFDGDRALLRTEGNRGLAFMADQTATILDAALEDSAQRNKSLDSAITIRFQYPEEDESAHLLVNLIENELVAYQASQDEECPVTIERDYLATTPFDILCTYLCTSTNEKNVLNLLQGEFKQDISRVGTNIKWKPMAALFSMWMLLFLGGQLGQTYYYDQKAEELDQESKAYFRTLFPETKKVKNVKKQMSSIIRQAGAGDDSAGFVPLLGSTGQLVYDLNKKKSDTVLLERITFDDKQGNLRVDMRISDFTELEFLKQQIEKTGLTVTIDAATKDADKVKARLRIKG